MPARRTKRAADQRPGRRIAPVQGDLEVGPAQLTLDLLVARLDPVAQPVQAYHLGKLGRLGPAAGGTGQVGQQVSGTVPRQLAGVGGGHHQPQPPIRFSAERPHGSAASCTGSFRVPPNTTTSIRPPHPAPVLPTIACHFLARNAHVLLPLKIAIRALVSDVLSPQTISEESNAPAVRSLAPTKARRGAAGWWPTSPSSRWAVRSTTPASWPPTNRRTCPATVSPQAAGTAPAPVLSACRAKHRWPGSSACLRAGTRRLGSCWAVRMAATRCLLRRGVAADQERVGPVRPR
jgi:hypothetical protein